MLLALKSVLTCIFPQDSCIAFKGELLNSCKLELVSVSTLIVVCTLSHYNNNTRYNRQRCIYLGTLGIEPVSELPKEPRQVQRMLMTRWLTNFNAGVTAHINASLDMNVIQPFWFCLFQCLMEDKSKFACDQFAAFAISCLRNNVDVSGWKERTGCN